MATLTLNRPTHQSNGHVRRQTPPNLNVMAASPTSGNGDDSLNTQQKKKLHRVSLTSPSPLAPKIDDIIYHLDHTHIGSESSDGTPSSGSSFSSPTSTLSDSGSLSSVAAARGAWSSSIDTIPEDATLLRHHSSKHHLGVSEHDDHHNNLEVPARGGRRKGGRKLAHLQDYSDSTVKLREIARRVNGAKLKWDVPPRTVLIVTKAHDPSLVRLTKDVSAWLMDIGMTVIVENKFRTDPAFEYDDLLSGSCSSSDESDSESPSSGSGSDSTLTDDPRPPTRVPRHQIYAQHLKFWDKEYCRTKAGDEVDFVITLGGDGTVLYAAFLFQGKCPPLIPFNLGSLGFLTVFDFHKFRNTIKTILEDEAGMRLNFRMRFACTVHRNKQKPQDEMAMFAYTVGARTTDDDDGKTFHILNDLVVDRGPSPYVSQLELFGNGKHLTTAAADGLAVATPTGSTAYSLSAGGSVVHPDVSAILVTPICPHTLSFRPMILPDTMELKIMVPEDSRATAWASFDGRHRVQLSKGDSITITASQYPVPTVCLGDQSSDWFNGLERCLGWNIRERQKAFTKKDW
ncbi:hypothetical protein HK102_000345 [Quaeritorhiza haematococci]|nr:hypothetical protein HK102_000345 [Quaeritorhiza haematococci]